MYENILSSAPILSGFTRHADFTLDKIKMYCKIETGSFEDDMLTDMLDSSIELAMGQSGLTLGTGTYTVYYDCLGLNYINLLYSPLASVTSIKGLMEDGTENLLDPADYIVESGNNGIVQLKNGSTWPNTDKQKAGYEVVYVNTLNTLPKVILAGCNVDMFSRYHDRQRVETPKSAIAKWQSAKVKICSKMRIIIFHQLDFGWILSNIIFYDI